MCIFPTLHELRTLLQADALALRDGPLTGIGTDSRTLEPGALFVALRGEKFDGHAFVADVLARGAAAAVVEASWRGPVELEPRLLRVVSTQAAYQALGRWRRLRFAGPVVGITGSVGKTTTKELVAAALNTAGPTVRTAANHNNELGVPRTLLELRAAHRFAVIEMGMRGPGQIRELAELALPDVGLITNVGTAHIGLLGSREAIAQAKCELLASLRPGGLAVLNADSPLLLDTARRIWTGRTVTYGLHAGELRGELVGAAELRVGSELLRCPLPGEHNALNWLAALAVARELGIRWSDLAELRVELPAGRARRLELATGLVVLDETYNAGPESMEASLRLLAAERARRRIAVLGAMMELGDHGRELHRAVGRTVAELGLEALVVLDQSPDTHALVEGAAGVPTDCFASHAELLAHLRARLGAGDCVLLKASHSVGLDRVVAELVSGATPERAP